MSLLTTLSAREILDSRGNPTVEATVTLEGGVCATAAVPSGASTGTFEAHELRDGDEKRYAGLGVRSVVSNIEGEIADALRGSDVADQRGLDHKLVTLDGTPNKSRLGANALLAVSLSCARAVAQERSVILADYIRSLFQTPPPVGSFPVPMFNILNGGQHSDSGLSIQEFKIIPAGIATYPEQLRAGSEIFHALKSILGKRGYSVGVGDEGGFAPRLESHAQALELIVEAIEKAGYTPGKQVFVGLDTAANSFYLKDSDQYHLEPEGATLSRESLVNLYREWMHQFPLVSIEDGLQEEDWSGWKALREKLENEPAAWGKKVLLVGDDLLVTNVARLEKSLMEQSCNAVLVKPNQIGTLTETLDFIALAKKHSMSAMISHRSGETTDDFIADLAVGSGAEFIKTGSLSRGERLAKYNRLLFLYEKSHNTPANS